MRSIPVFRLNPPGIVTAITGTNPEGRVVLWDGGAERLYGWTRREALGRILPPVFPEHPKTREHLAALEDFKGILERSRQHPIAGAVRPRWRKDGSIVWVNLSVFCVNAYDLIVREAFKRELGTDYIFAALSKPCEARCHAIAPDYICPADKVHRCIGSTGHSGPHETACGAYWTEREIESTEKLRATIRRAALEVVP